MTNHFQKIQQFLIPPLHGIRLNPGNLLKIHHPLRRFSMNYITKKTTLVPLLLPPSHLFLLIISLHCLPPHHYHRPRLRHSLSKQFINLRLKGKTGTPFIHQAARRSFTSIVTVFLQGILIVFRYVQKGLDLKALMMLKIL